LHVIAPFKRSCEFTSNGTGNSGDEESMGMAVIKFQEYFLMESIKFRYKKPLQINRFYK